MEIVSANYLISNASYKECPKPDRAEYAFIGRSNVGKSSLINMICNKTHLAKISSTPGKTQLINHFEIVSSDRKKWFLVDLPGYGYASVAQRSRRRWEQMIEGYIRHRQNLVCLFLLIDVRQDPQAIDLSFIDQLGKWNAPFVMVFTKSDKNKPGATTRKIENFLAAMAERWEQPPRYFVTASPKGTGRKELLQYIRELNEGFALI